LVQIIYMKMGMPAPSQADCVLVERLPGGKFTARGSVTSSHRVAFFNPSSFDSLDEAFASSKSWAEENKVTVIYVKAWT
jgi:hypothetical protein